MFGPSHAVVREALVERRDAHRPHALGDQVADRVVDHRGGDRPCCRRKQSARLAAHVELAAAHVDRALRRLAEGDDAGVEPVHERAEREEVERAVGADRRGPASWSVTPLAHGPVTWRPATRCGTSPRGLSTRGTCARRSSRAGPGSGWPAAARCGRRRSTRATRASAGTGMPSPTAVCTTKRQASCRSSTAVRNASSSSRFDERRVAPEGVADVAEQRRADDAARPPDAGDLARLRCRSRTPRTRCAAAPMPCA